MKSEGVLGRTVSSKNKNRNFKPFGWRKMWTQQKEALEEFHKQMFLVIKALEERKIKEEWELLEKKYKVERLKKEKECARFLERKETLCGRRCGYQCHKLFSFSLNCTRHK